MRILIAFLIFMTIDTMLYVAADREVTLGPNHAMYKLPFGGGIAAMIVSHSRCK